MIRSMGSAKHVTSTYTAMKQRGWGRITKRMAGRMMYWFINVRRNSSPYYRSINPPRFTLFRVK